MRQTTLLTFPQGGAQQTLERVKRLFRSPMGRGAFAQPMGGEIAAAAVFTPASIAGLYAWFDFSDASTLYKESTFSNLVTADADPIGGVIDKSGLGHYVIQATAGRRPTYKTAIKNGKSVSRHTHAAINHYTRDSSFTMAQPTTIVVVGKSTAAQAAYHFVDGGSSRQLVGFGSPNFQMYAGTVLDGSAVSTNWILFTAIFNSTASYCFINGAQKSTGNTGTQSLTEVYVGSGTGGTDWSMDGDLGEVLFYSGALSTTNRQALESYLNAKWAIY